MNGGRRDGWYFDSEHLVLDFYLDGTLRYQMDLEGCSTCAELLDWVFQIAQKAEGFVSNEHLGQYVRLLNEVLDPQATLCGWGKDRGPIDVKAVVPRVAARRAKDAEFGRLFMLKSGGLGAGE